MQVMTDRAADLSPQQLEGLKLHYAPFVFTLDGKEYSSGVDIQPDEFYLLLESTDGMPSTSVPAPGMFVDLYREMAKTDPDILYVHVSSGLSGTYNSAHVAADMVPEANVHFFDAMTLSGAQGWQVEAAARAVQAGWTLDQVFELLRKIQNMTSTLYTLPSLKYLIHGGRIGHLGGLLANTLNIKPIIGVSKTDGKYEQRGRVRTFKRAVEQIPNLMAQQYPEGSEMRVQVLHAHNPEGAELLHEGINQKFKATFLPGGPIAPVLGAHSGPGLVGVVYAPCADFPHMP